METQLSLPKKGAEPPPQFLVPVCCGQTAGWIKVALRVEVGLGQGHIVLDRDPDTLPKRGQSPQFPIFQHLGFLHFGDFNGRNSQEGQNASACQISW